jgi:hypothetical protein
MGFASLVTAVIGLALVVVGLGLGVIDGLVLGGMVGLVVGTGLIGLALISKDDN